MTTAQAFAEEIQRYGERISAPVHSLPGCDSSGANWWVEVSGDPAEYRLAGFRHDHNVVYITSGDGHEVLEYIFSQITFQMAFMPLIGGTDGTLETEKRLCRQAEPEQERLMAQLNPQWGERQKARNAAFWASRATNRTTA